MRTGTTDEKKHTLTFIHTSPRSNFFRLMKQLLILTTALILTSCATVPIPVGHGHIELDENTDPRFAKPDTEGAIGTVVARGSAVYVNGKTIGYSARLMNNDRVHTERNSQAHIRFTGLLFAECPQGIHVEEFRTGKLLGDTHACRHHLTINNGTMTTHDGSTEYHIHTYPNYSELTVISGSAYVIPRSAPGSRIRVDSSHELKLEGQRVIGPRRLSQREIDERISWARTTVPNVTGLNISRATGSLKEAELKVGTVTYVDNSNSKVTGLVQRQSPTSGSKVRYDTSVRLWVWKKPVPVDKTPIDQVRLISVPKLVGRSLSDAQKILKRSGFTQGKVSTVKNDGTHQANQVQRQSPAGGSKQAPKSSVNLWIWDRSNIIQ